MFSPVLPLNFDHTSIVHFFREESFRDFLSGATVTLEDSTEVDDAVPVCLDPECLVDGSCLVALESEIDLKVSPDPERPRDTVPAVNTHDYVVGVMGSFWLAEHRGGYVCRTSDQPLQHLLQAKRRALEDDAIDAIPMKSLETWMCCDGGAISNRDRIMYQYPGSYRTLYETGTLAGIINRSSCHLGCGADFAWIEDDLCLFWMRLREGPWVKWVRLFPFRVDRSGKPGRLSSRFRSRYLWGDLLGRLGYRRQSARPAGDA